MKALTYVLLQFHCKKNSNPLRDKIHRINCKNKKNNRSKVQAEITHLNNMHILFSEMQLLFFRYSTIIALMKFVFL